MRTLPEIRYSMFYSVVAYCLPIIAQTGYSSFVANTR